MLIALNERNERVSINDSLENDKYFCQFCGEELCRKLGPIRLHHFSHKSNSHCTDSKWHDMSEWHINWQNQFPTDYQEILKINSDGKKHIADVLIKEKTVVEFQHSNLPYEVFNDRNEFYNKMGYRVVWVFDGNNIINNGDINIRIDYRNPLKPLSKQGQIPNYLDIFIEGTIVHNLFDEDDGKFLYHVNSLSSIGIELDGKIRPIDFISKVSNNESFSFGIPIVFFEEEMKRKNNLINEKKTLVEIIKEHSDANTIIVYNTKTGYDVAINKENMNRALEKKGVYGKIKKHKEHDYKSNFQNNSPDELYYVKEPVWIYQIDYK